MLKRIVVIGPECTGKSFLCEQLAAHYKTAWCPEYAREYLLTQGKDYDYDDLLTIAKGQLAQEDQLAEKVNAAEGNTGSLLIIDTDMYVMKVWSEFVFGKCHRFILEQIVERRYDHYLLCNVDLPWVKDELREHPDLATRQKLFMMYRDCMINQDVPWTTISGNYEERLHKAIAVVDNITS